MFNVLCSALLYFVYKPNQRMGLCEGSPESVHTTVRELEENLKGGLMAAVGPSKTNLAHAKVVGTSCDVCDPEDVQKLANFAVGELGSIDIWVGVCSLSWCLSLVSSFCFSFLLDFLLCT